MHAYYDICPESPDGAGLIWFEFDGPVPGSGEVVLGDREGGHRRVLDRGVLGIGHVGGFCTFVAANHVSWTARGQGDPVTRIQALDTGEHRDLEGALRQTCLETGYAFLQARDTADNPHGLAQAVRIVEALGSGRTLLEFGVAEAAKVCPDGVPPLEQLQLQNTKWTPDGQRFLVVFTNEAYARQNPQSNAPRFKCILVGELSRKLTFLASFGHHPAWLPDGSGVYSYDRQGEATQALALDRPGQARVVLHPDLPGTHPTFHPTRPWLVSDIFVQDGESVEIALWRTDTWAKTVLARYPHTRFHHQDGFHPHPVFSRDGRRLYFNGMDGGPCGLWALDLPETV
jgi:hypothetical protein